MGVVARAGGCVGRNGGLDGCNLFRCEPDFECGQGFAELGTGASTDDRNDEGTFGKGPGNGELGLGDALAGCNLSETRNDFLILCKVLVVNTREAVADIALAAVGGTGEKSARKDAVGGNGNAEVIEDGKIWTRASG